MLYQTHYPSFLFQFHPPPFFTCSTSTPSSSSSSSSSSPLSLSLPPSATITPTSTTTHLSSLPRVEGSEMECVALKTSFRKEMAVKEVFDDLLWGLNGQSGAVQNCEDFSVDDLLDFSNDDGFVADDEAHEDENKPNTEQPSSLKAAVITPEEEEKDISTPSSCLSEKNELVEPNSELSVPADDLENLEWLSHFVEDSFSGYNASLPAGFLAVKPKNPAENRPLPDALKPCFKSPVPGKARSKRTRTGGRVWSTLGSPSLSESSSTSSSSSSSTTPSSCPLLMYATAERPSQQKKLKRSSAGGGASRMMEGPTGGSTRRCSHCGVQKTPQWRTGPNGAKTLCNACGVRYKSGRLVPEYRPAGSPTFSSELHSNHHRKVMEIRRKKEVVVVPSQVVVMPEPGLMTTAATTPVVRNF